MRGQVSAETQGDAWEGGFQIKKASMEIQRGKSLGSNSNWFSPSLMSSTD